KTKSNETISVFYLNLYKENKLKPIWQKKIPFKYLTSNIETYFFYSNSPANSIDANKKFIINKVFKNSVEIQYTENEKTAFLKHEELLDSSQTLFVNFNNKYNLMSFE